MSRVLSAEQAVALIKDGATVAVTGSGGGVLEPDGLLGALERRFLTTGHPTALSFVHSLGFGDRKMRGTNRFAHVGMTRRVIAGHWTWSPSLIELAADNAVEAYAFPAGVISLLLRESGAGRPGLITKVGLHTFADPRLGGGQCNKAAKADLVELIELDGEEYLRYKPLRVDIALIRGSEVDAQGNLSCAHEAAQLDAWAVALAAHGSGGVVLAQVKRFVDHIDPRLVHVPGVLVDGVVLDASQLQTYQSEFDPVLCGEGTAPSVESRFDDTVKGAIARRAALEVERGDVLCVGFGTSSLVVDALVEAGRLDEVTVLVEQGMIGGVPLSGDAFGVVRGPRVVMPSANQFEHFSAGVLDVCCLGMAQVDGRGSVNVSRIGGRVGGPGGFVDISQHARRVIFCGPFTAGGLVAAVEAGGIRIRQEGTISKFVTTLEEVTYSGPLALREGRQAIYVTERAVFRLGSAGLELVEVANGISVERDILPHMGFRPVIKEVVEMPEAVFGLHRSEGDGSL